MKSLRSIREKVESGERLSASDGVALFKSNDVLETGRLANIVRERKNGNRAYYIINYHINYANICVNRCRFCAFSRSAGEDGAYEMDMEEILRRADEAARMGATEIHIVGGLHPALPFEFYTEMLREIRSRHPHIHLQAFTAVEIAHIAGVGGMPVGDALVELREAGLGSLPGGGAEVFAPRVRREICPEKLPGEKWLDVMRTAHRLNIRSNATMLYGHVETPEEKIEHLIKLRELQDETGGFMSFIPLAFHPRNTGISRRFGTTGIEDLKHLAIARLMLDNFDHIKAFWIMLGLKLSQVSLSFGVDDIDGTVVEEKITHMAGAETPRGVSVEELRGLIREAGRTPVRRDTLYNAPLDS
ncbi:MAG: aminofutalosine synthase MqnE [Planctomycetota bacterium]|nr:MAG: aminofutalosine synthase MqnE [Planctomycetota bacterium]